jgi:hypothetical protein
VLLLGAEAARAQEAAAAAFLAWLLRAFTARPVPATGRAEWAGRFAAGPYYGRPLSLSEAQPCAAAWVAERGGIWATVPVPAGPAAAAAGGWEVRGLAGGRAGAAPAAEWAAAAGARAEAWVEPALPRGPPRAWTERGLAARAAAHPLWDGALLPPAGAVEALLAGRLGLPAGPPGAAAAGARAFRASAAELERRLRLAGLADTDRHRVFRACTWAARAGCGPTRTGMAGGRDPGASAALPRPAEPLVGNRPGPDGPARQCTLVWCSLAAHSRARSRARPRGPLQRSCRHHNHLWGGWGEST